MILPFPVFVGNAGAPFDRQDADVVLRSQDGIDFRTFKAHLSSASDVFKLMFFESNPQSFETANEEEVSVDGLSVIPFYDDPSHVLNALLCYCHPDITSRSSSVALVDVQRLAMKYDMLSVAKEVYRKRIKQERKLPPRPMLDTIRQKVGQDEDIYLAAASIFTCSEDEAAEMVDVGFVSRAQFDSLLLYREKCREEASKVAQPDHGHFTWMSPKYKWVGDHGEYNERCDRGGNIFIGSVSGRIMTRRWWRVYMQEMGSRLKERPWGTTLKTGDFFDQALKWGARCKVCAKDLDRDFGGFVEILAREVDSAVSQARYRTSLSSTWY